MFLEPVPHGNSRFEVQRDLGRGKAERVAVFDSLEDAKEYVRRFNKAAKTTTRVNNSEVL